MMTKGKEPGRVAGYAALLILFYWALHNLHTLSGWLGVVMGLFAPFLLGLTLAFILNVPMTALEKLLFSRLKGRKRSLVRMLSLVLTLTIILGLIFIVLFLVVPELANSVTMLGNSIPGFLERMGAWATAMDRQYPEIYQTLGSLEMDWNSLVNQMIDVLKGGLTGLLSSILMVATGVFSGLLSFFLAAIFAVYVLLQKEKLGQQAMDILYAFLPRQRANRMMAVTTLTAKTFSSFLTGQCLEAVILGFMFFVAMTIFQFPYALLVSVLTGFSALIPMFGAFIGCAVGTFLILMVNPIQALWFLALFILLQQIEGNLIYPRVVGGSIGLPSIWVLLAVTVGGSAMGIAGMLIFIPLCSVLYTLLWEAVDRRKAAQGIITEEEQNLTEKEILS